MNTKVYTNNHKRQFIYGYELTKKELSEFDWISDDEILDHTFLRYKGWVYSIDDFMRIDTQAMGISDEFAKWNGYCSDSFFSGILIRLLNDDFDGDYQVATYIA